MDLHEDRFEVISYEINSSSTLKELPFSYSHIVSTPTRMKHPMEMTWLSLLLGQILHPTANDHTHQHHRQQREENGVLGP